MDVCIKDSSELKQKFVKELVGDLKSDLSSTRKLSIDVKFLPCKILNNCVFIHYGKVKTLSEFTTNWCKFLKSILGN